MYGYLIFSSEYCGCSRSESIRYQHDQVVLSDETNMSNDEASTESTVSDEINGTTQSESKISEETSENSKNDESESSVGNIKAESTENI